MSKYEMLDYDELLQRCGIAPNQTWFCGDNPPEELTYEETGIRYNDVRSSYNGRGQQVGGGLCLSEDINVNGLLLNHRDRNGTIWLCTDIEGWWTLPPSEIPEVPKPYWDGNLLTTGRYLARQITVSGCFLPPDTSLVWYNRDALLRVSSIVRGIGLIALCGNESPFITEDSPFFDPPKMAIIQMSDVPLVETTRTNGFTQFSLSFRCVQPTKLSLYETVKSLPIETNEVVRTRRYKAFALTAEEDPTSPTTSYDELREIVGNPDGRKYSDVERVVLDSLIEDEDLEEGGVVPEDSYIESQPVSTAVLNNAGNYFAFPIFVFDQLDNLAKGRVLTVRNLTTGEKMEIQKPVPQGSQLVVDTSLRRVAIVDPKLDPSDWVWDDRDALTLTSRWISLAPGENTIIVSKPPVIPNDPKPVKVPIQPSIYFRDTWIG